jgi:chromosome segregation ATPase
MSQLEISIADKEQQLVFLQGECSDAALKLSGYNKLHKEAENDLEETKKEKEKLLHEIEIDRIQLNDAKENLRKEKEEFNEEKRKWDGELNQRKQKNKEVTKELCWLNSKISNAENTLNELLEAQEEVKRFIANRDSLVAEIESLQGTILQINSEKNRLLSQIYDESTRSASLLYEKQQEYDKLVIEAESLVFLKNSAKAELENLIREMDRKHTDWEIIKNRLEIRFKEHYPELEMKI